PFLGERPIAPIVQQPVMQPILIYGRELVPQPLVEIIDDAGIAFHARTPVRQPNGAVSDRVPVLQCAMRLGSIQPRILRKLTGAGSGFWPDIRPLARLAGSHGASGTGERLVHDAPDGPGAASALRAAAEAIVDFAGGARREARADDGAAYLL